MVNSRVRGQGSSYFVKNVEADSTYMFLVRAFSSKAVGLPSVISDSVTTIGMYRWSMVGVRGQGSSYFVKNVEADSTYMFLVRDVNSKAVGLPSVISDPVTTIGMY